MIKTMADALAPDRVGWKFARLQPLLRAGLTVPPFFCLTDRFYRRVVGPVLAGINAIVATIDFDDWPAVQAAAERIRAIVRSRPFDPAADALLDDALARTFPPDALLAVRASVIAASLDESEDSASNPLAGLSDSFLYVPREQVRAAVLDCWASGFSAEGLLYRHRQGLSVDGLTVAVGVQQMIPGTRSLVMFTCDPTNHAQDVVISAAWGIGEGVVQEQADTDHYFLRAGTGTIDRHITPKRRMVTMDEVRGSGTVVRDVPADRREVPVLTDEEIRALAETGRRIERILGEPQDIEATITADGRVHVLQSRPIAITPQQHRIFSSANICESFPGVTTPMTYSVARRFYWLLNHDYLRRCGASPRRLHDLHETMTRLVAYLDGRIYHNITSFMRMLRVLPFFDGYRRDWERLVAELDTFYHHEPAPPLGRVQRLRRAARLVLDYARAGVNLVRLPRDFAAFEAEWAALLDRQRATPVTGRHPLALVADYREVWERAANMWGVTLINYQFMVFSQKGIEHCLTRWGLRGEDTLSADLLCGGRQLRGAEIALNAVRLAELVRADPALSGLFRDRTPEELWRRLAAGELPATFSAAVHDHLRRYGDRGLQELKLERPNLRDTPEELIRLIAQYAGTDLTVAALEDAERANRAAGERRLRDLLSNRPVRRHLLLVLHDLLRTFLYYREVGRYMRSELFGYSKQVIAELGRQLAERGHLPRAEDVYLLDLDELFGFVDGTGSTTDLAGLVAVRAGDLRRAEQRVPAREFATGDIVGGGVPAAAPAEPTVADPAMADPAGGPGVLTGIGSCAGRVRGRARVVDDPALGTEFDADSILVARETDPGWLFLMMKSRAIVVERGSMLSHTAITGRKFGIPTIVAVRDATRLIRDGDLIEVDGGTGRVTLLSGQYA